MSIGKMSRFTRFDVCWQNYRRLPCYVLLYLYVDIAGSGDPLYVADSCNWRSTAREGQMDWFFVVAKKHFIHILLVKMQKNKTKNWQKPWKKMFCLALPAIWLQFHLIWGDLISGDLIWAGSYQVTSNELAHFRWPQMSWLIWSETQPDGQKG